MIYKNFINNITIICKSGNGGNGCVHFFKNFKKIGKPDGGNGGNGGNIIFVGNKYLLTLYYFENNKIFKAENGYNGMRDCKTGRNGKDCIIYIPLKTTIEYYNNNIKKKIKIKNHNQKEVIIYGGKGGKGNNYYKNSVYPKSKKYSLGKKGLKKKINIKLKRIFHISIIGLPNTGKTTLLTKITNNKNYKVANYEYTTTKPNLGIYKNKLNNYLIIDMPPFNYKSIYNYEYINLLENNIITIFVLSMINFIKEYYTIKEILENNKIKTKNIIIILSKYNKINIYKLRIFKRKIKKKFKDRTFFFFSLNKNIEIIKEKINKILS